ncbi:hypothetical protein J3R82DRAFT_11258 [Butyriboletus roseoflavus]|nr:hypothetical protein J3R82DRAFT_11258 [Butyriboletus roseoflavus]
MLFCIICSFRRLHASQQINSEQVPPLSSDLSRELEDLHKFSLSSLLALLAVFAISGSKALLPAALALLIYTISLRLAVNVCFLRNYPSLSRFLHAIPLLGTSCMAGVELVIDVQSPSVSVIVLLLSVFPFATTILHHGRWHEELPLPMRMRGRPPTLLGSIDTTITVVSNQNESGVVAPAG